MDIGTYRYQALAEADSIRLLILHPSGVAGSILQGSLLVTTLSDCDYDLIEPYTALSYVWGDPSQTGKLVLDGQHTVTITATLAAALTDLRDGMRPRRIWADALCIDQSNLAERNHQVSLMGAIYRTAHNTVIHLGAPSPESELILQHTPRASASIFPAIDGPTRDAIHHAALAELLNRPWFRRVWIFQELILSRDPWVQCGQLRARWTDLVSLLLPSGPAQGGEPPFRLLNAMQQARGYSNAGTMAMLLRARRGLGATDARDFVFAHLGIVSDAAAVQADVPVDYAVSVGQVFGRMASYLVRVDGLENVLGMVDSERTSESLAQGTRKEGLPSWAPDWTREGGKLADMYKDNMMNRFFFGGNFSAFIDSGTERLLLAAGQHVDVVSKVGSLLPPKPIQSPGQRYQDAVDGVRAIYSAGGGVWYSGDALGRHPHVSIRGSEAEHERLCRIIGEEWVRCLRHPKAGLTDAPVDPLLGLLDAWLHDQANKARIYVNSSSDGLVRLLQDYVNPAIAGSPLEGRRLAQTREGLLGLAPPHAQDGDLFVSLAGNEMAVVLRRLSMPDFHASDAVIRSAPSVQGLSIALSKEAEPFWSASVNNNYAVEHCQLVGYGYLDGEASWHVRSKPRAADITLFALH